MRHEQPSAATTLREKVRAATQDSQPFVSVVVPTHGRRAMLARLLASLRRQNYPAERFEIIVVHNWTADGTEEMVTKLNDGAFPLLSYHRKNYVSPTASRQFGADIARGVVIAFIDDDCEADVGWIKAGVGAMSAGTGVVQGCTLPRSDQPRRFLEKTVSVTNPTPFFETCNIFYRKEAFERVGGFSTEFHERFFGEDTDLGWKVTTAGWRRAFAREAIVHHEVFAQSPVAWHCQVLPLKDLPMLVRKWPAMRRELYGGYFLSRQSAAFVLGIAGLALALVVHPAALALTAPYAIVRTIETGRYSNPALIAARVVLGLPRATLMFAALAYGSVRHRTLVL